MPFTKQSWIPGAISTTWNNNEKQLIREYDLSTEYFSHDISGFPRATPQKSQSATDRIWKAAFQTNIYQKRPWIVNILNGIELCLLRSRYCLLICSNTFLIRRWRKNSGWNVAQSSKWFIAKTWIVNNIKCSGFGPTKTSDFQKHLTFFHKNFALIKRLFQTASRYHQNLFETLGSYYV